MINHSRLLPVAIIGVAIINEQNPPKGDKIIPRILEI
jgi:hypothetical protein